MTWEQPEMFPLPRKDRPPQHGTETDITWRVYRGKRTSCDECIVDIAKGELRFASAPAGHVRTYLGVATFLCNRHAQDRKIKDGL